MKKRVPKRKEKGIPKFRSEKDEARFWSKHSPLDYPDEFNEVKKPFKFSAALLKKVAKKREERKRSLTIRIGQRQIDLTKVIARLKGLGYQTQMRMWVIEGIHKELRVHPEIKKVFSSK